MHNALFWLFESIEFSSLQSLSLLFHTRPLSLCFPVPVFDFLLASLSDLAFSLPIVITPNLVKKAKSLRVSPRRSRPFPFCVCYAVLFLRLALYSLPLPLVPNSRVQTFSYLLR